MDPTYELLERQLMTKARTRYFSDFPEAPPVAIRKDRRRALLLCFINVAPIVVSFTILQLSFRNVYWEDVNAPNRVAKLGGFQVAAKLHEVLTTLSLSYLILHYVRGDLASSDSLPFGLFEAAFRLTLGGQPTSYGLWAASKDVLKPSTWATRRRLLRLMSLVVTATLLGFAIGPASAITAIPKLGWWYKQDMFVLPAGVTGRGPWKSRIAVRASHDIDENERLRFVVMKGLTTKENARKPSEIELNSVE